MKKLVAVLVAFAIASGAAWAVPSTTRPSFSDMLAAFGCAATNLIIGGTSQPACGPAFGSANTANAIVQRDGSGNFSAGTITAALNGNAATVTTVSTTAWSSYTPTMSCSASGGPPTTTSSGRFKTIGKTIFLELDINITALNSCTGNLLVAGPAGVTFQANSAGAAVNNNTGALVPVIVGAGGTTVLFSFASAPAANRYFAGGVFETQ